MKKKHVVTYTIWLAWDKPIVGASFPPGDEKPYSLQLIDNLDPDIQDQVVETFPPPSYIKLIENEDTRLGKNVWVHVGTPKMYNAMVFYQKQHAEMWTSRLPGSYIEES